VVVGGVLTIAGNERLEHRREKRERKRGRDAAVGELLTATVDLVSGVQAIRVAYEGRSGLRMRLRVVATVFAAVSSAFAAAGEVSLGALLDWRHSVRVIDRILSEDRHLDEVQRTTALDVTAVVMARAARFYAALAAITVGGNERGLSESANRLAEAVGRLLEAIGAKRRKYQQARLGAERALSEFRRAADRGSR